MKLRSKLFNKYFFTFLCIAFYSTNSYPQVTLRATASSGSAYNVITAAGFQYESPDCEHTSFGPHVTQAYDSQLGKNVFVFHSHINADNDRCVNFDRVRMEIKGATGSPSTLLHTNGQTAYYRWKFRLPSDFVGSSSFCHIFQIKAQGGDAGAPLITITPRSSTLQVIHDGGDDGTGTDLGVLAEVSLSPFLGTWVEAYVKYKSSNNGSFEITLRRISDGATLLSYSRSSGIDMWRTGADHNRPKWGVYRKKASGLKDEQVRFADFCVSESSADQCPSDITQQVSIYIQAESGTLTSPMQVYSDANASGGKYIAVMSGSNSTSSPPSTGRATYTFSVPVSGTYQVEGRVIAPSTSRDSYWIRMDNGNWIKWNKIELGSNWHWDEIHDNDNNNQIVNFNLSAGTHTLTVAYREVGTKLDRIRIYNYDLQKTSPEVEENKDTNAEKPTDFELYAYPNPFNPATNIVYKLPEAKHVRIVIYDITGQMIKTLIDEFKEAGTYQVTWNINESSYGSMASGTYIAKLEAGNYVKSIKLLLAK